MIDHHPTPDLATAQSLGLSKEEYNRIIELMGRTPNFTELSLFSVMWSEHCSYKNSIKYLKTLPNTGDRLLVEAGEENAGLVDIGHGIGCAFKIESHNSPSAIEPYHGAATGVGGIHRDIFTMGARPIAALNSLRMGNIERSHTRWLLRGVVNGIGDYGNSLGVPTVGGEVYFNDSYNQNILVNAMSVGIVKKGETISAVAEGPGNKIFIVGSATGKDGIHGATFSSAELHEDSADEIPPIQVGDPFQEKLLLEASLEAMKSGAVIGMQDMGAAGIISSSAEMAAKSKVGMNINLDKVPTRQKNMEAYEILLSESQERMLVVCKKGKEEVLKKVYEKWDLPCDEIGEVTDTGYMEFWRHGEMVARVSADALAGDGVPEYEREYHEAEYYSRLKDYDADQIDEPEDYISAAKKLGQSPNLVSKRWIYEQYDHTSGGNTMGTSRQADAAVVRVKGTDTALAMTVDCNSDYVYADPYTGTMIAVSEAARNIVCSGGEPVAISNCLNFGNPFNKEVYWQFVQAIKGMSEACIRLGTPVTGGNVSFYNQTEIAGKTDPIKPTPTIGMIGILEKTDQYLGSGFAQEGDLIVLIGKEIFDLNNSEYLKWNHSITDSKVPYFSLDEEIQAQKTIREANQKGLLRSAHDLSEGGLFFALLESSFEKELGIQIDYSPEVRLDSFLFGESQSRILVSLDPENFETLENISRHNSVPIAKLGYVGGGDIQINHLNFGSVSQWKEIHNNLLEEKLEK